MRKQIRCNIFETNSSSVHSICIAKKNITKDDLPEHLTFSHGEFGWENKKYTDVKNKASYLYEAINAYYDKDKKRIECWKNQVYKILGRYGIVCDFEQDKKNEWGLSYGYIDHPEGIEEFVKRVTSSEKRLLRYLFSDDSFIITGNDNENHDIDIKVNYKHEEFWKGN